MNDPLMHGITIESILDPNHVEKPQHNKVGDAKYCVSFRIKYQTNLGQSLAIIGDIDELGCWKDFQKARMTWTEGHVWVLERHPINSSTIFNYKYVVLNNDNPEIWEKGQNRVADLTLLPDRSPPDSVFEIGAK